jgi:hypothetical protein
VSYSTSQALVPPRPAASAVGRGAFVALTIALWAAALLAILTLSLNYEFTPAPATSAPPEWPRESSLVRGSGPTLLVFLHPCCPCSRATLNELEQVLTHLPPSGSAYCLVSPLRVDKNFAHKPLVEMARQMTRLQVVIDSQGAESSRFGAQVSGRILLYDAAGQLQFTGGVTPSRGHSGANLGTQSLVALLTGQRAKTSATPVFGCPLPVVTPSHESHTLPTDASDR